jgi:hypothetical protein
MYAYTLVRNNETTKNLETCVTANTNLWSKTLKVFDRNYLKLSL